MRAVTISEFGGPEVLRTEDLPDPQAGNGEVRIRVAAATVNPTDLSMRAGAQAAALADLPAPYVPGLELSGIIDQAGPETGWRVGDRVMAIAQPKLTGRGAQAELAVVFADSVTRVPDGIELISAATVPMNGLTTRLALDLLGLAKGQTILITGAGGAVGGYAVQIAANEGLNVIAIASERDESDVRGFGASSFVVRGPNAIDEVRAIVPDGVDGLIDAAAIGEGAFKAIRDGGRYASVKGYKGDSERGIAILQVQVADYARNQAALDGLSKLVADGKLTLRISETFAPERASKAHEKLAAGGTRGRLVIVF